MNNPIRWIYWQMWEWDMRRKSRRAMGLRLDEILEPAMEDMMAHDLPILTAAVREQEKAKGRKLTEKELDTLVEETGSELEDHLPGTEAQIRGWLIEKTLRDIGL